MAPYLTEDETRALIDYAPQVRRGALALVAGAAAGTGDHEKLDLTRR
jgi:hypothetical protein